MGRKKRVDNVSEEFKHKRDLQEVCRRLGLSSNGTVPELKTMILAYFNATSAKQTGGAAQSPSSSLTRHQSAIASTCETPAPSAQRKKWRVTDPAEIAPNYYHHDLFKANFPLIDIVNIHRFPARNKFEQNVLDEEASSQARRQWIHRLFEVKQVYREPEDENQCAPFHFAFFEGLKQFTRPCRGEVEKQNAVLGKREWDFEEIKSCTKKPKVGEEYGGFYLVLGYEQRSDDDTVLEEDLQEPEDDATGFADGVLHVVDDTDEDVVVGVIERKFAEDKKKWDAKYQGGFYAVKHCLLNLENGHGKAIYVIVMTKTTWSYGIMCPEGCVQVGSDGKVDSASYPAFVEQQQMTGEQQDLLKADTISLESLQEKLALGTKFYRKNYEENPTASYAPGPMLVGKFYLCSEWFKLPDAIPGGGEHDDEKRLFSGLMRLANGDSVCDWTKEEFDRRRKLRKLFVKQQRSLWQPKLSVPASLRSFSSVISGSRICT